MTEDILNIEHYIWENVDNESRIGLYDGLAGTAFFYHRLLAVSNDKKHSERFVFILKKIDYLINNELQESTICSGLCGYAWVLLKCKSNKINIAKKYFKSIDTILLEELFVFSKQNNYDFMHGAMGIAFYLIESNNCNKKSIIAKALNKFIQDLSLKIQFDLKSVLEKSSVLFPEKHVFVGIAHGVAGFINFLTYANQYFAELSVDITDSLKILIDYLLNFKSNTYHSEQLYPNSVFVRTNEIKCAIFGWCQGDLGVANSLLNAATFFNDKSLKNEAVELLENSKKITFAESKIKDFGICHGSCGILIQYQLASNKLNTSYDECIEKWYFHLVQQTKNFKEFLSHQGADLYLKDMNLLSGATGLALVLLTCESDSNLDWLNAFNLH